MCVKNNTADTPSPGFVNWSKKSVRLRVSAQKIKRTSSTR